MSRILITGIAGFIGSHLAERLLINGYEVVGIDSFDPFYPRALKEQNLAEIRKTGTFEFFDLDFSEPGAMERISGNVDAVIHLGAKAGVLPSLKDPAAYIKTNIQGTQNILEWMRARSITKLVFASSSSVYGNNQTPFSESDDVSKPISPYAFTKKSCELLNHTYHHLYGFDVINLRFFTVFGERQRPDLAIHKFVKAILADEPITMFGDGSTARDYTYVLDIVEGITSALSYVQQHGRVFEIINLGNYAPVSLREMIDTIYSVLGKSPRIHQIEKQPGDVEITWANIEKAKTLLGYQPMTSFREGVERFILWAQGQ